MGASNNEVRLEGRITAEPELRYTTSGKPVANFSLAVRREWDGKGEADFMPVVAWNRTAEAIAQYVVKDQQLTVSGRMQSRSYQMQDGAKRTLIEVVAREVKFGRKPHAKAGDGGAAVPAEAA